MILAVSFSGKTATSIGSLVVTTDSRVFTLTDDQPDFDKVLALLKDSKNDEAEIMLDRLTTVRAAVVNSKFAINGNVVTFAGRNLPSVMAEYVIRMNSEGFDLTPLERFTENLYENPSFRAINEAFLFITANKMPITEDGCFIGYRAVTSDYKDIRTRTFDNSIGAVCEEPRNLVDENPDITCSNGLHVCSLSYINGPGAGYGHSDSPWIIVKVNPRDVVAVPRDYNNTKLRCCRFEVVGELDRTKISREDKQSYRESSAVFKETDAELRKAGKFYELGEKHRKNNDTRGSGQPLTNDTFGADENHNYYNYLDGYYGRARGHSIPAKAVAPAAVVTAGTATYGSNAHRARIMFNEGRFTDLMNFKKEKRVSFSRLGFSATEEAQIERCRNQNGTPAKPVYTDSLGYEVSEQLVFDKHGYDQFGFRRSGYNRKGNHRGGYASNQATPAAQNNVNAPKPAVPPAAVVTDFSSIDVNSVLGQTLNLIKDFFAVEVNDVTDHLVTDLDADSLDLIELVMALEEAFTINISDDDIEKQTDLTIKGIAAFVESKLIPTEVPAPVVVTPATVVNPATLVTSDKYAQGHADGAVATSFQPKQVGPEYWNGFTESWKTNPNNQNR